MAGGVPAGLRRWLLSGWLRAGFDAFMTWAAIRQASGRKSSLFRPVSLCPRGFRLALSVGRRVAACPSGRGAGRVVRSCGMGAGLAALVPCLLSVSPAGRAGAVCAGAGHGRRSQAKWFANQQNAQRFNKKCSIMTKIIPCILCFLRCKYACFGVK